MFYFLFFIIILIFIETAGRLRGRQSKGDTGKKVLVGSDPRHAEANVVPEDHDQICCLS